MNPCHKQQRDNRYVLKNGEWLVEGQEQMMQRQQWDALLFKINLELSLFRRITLHQ